MFAICWCQFEPKRPISAHCIFCQLRLRTLIATLTRASRAKRCADRDVNPRRSASVFLRITLPSDRLTRTAKAVTISSSRFEPRRLRQVPTNPFCHHQQFRIENITLLNRI